MTSTAKTGITANMAGLVDGTIADAADVLNPVTDLLNHAKSGRLGVTAADTHVKHLNDALVVGLGLEKTLLNPGADEIIELKGRTAIVPLTVLGGAGAGSFDMVSIPATYDHLRLVMAVRTGAALAAATSLQLRFNGDVTAANYASLTSNLQNSAALSTSEFLEGVITGARLAVSAPGNGAPAGYMGAIWLDLYEYAQTGRPRNGRWSGLVRVGNSSAEIRLLEGAFMWKNTADAINRITVVNETGTNFLAGSSYALYGVK